MLLVKIQVVLLQLKMWSLIAIMWFFTFSLPVPPFSAQLTGVASTVDCLALNMGIALLATSLTMPYLSGFDSLHGNHVGTAQ